MMGEDRPKAALRPQRPSGHRRQKPCLSRVLTVPCANQFTNHMQKALSPFEKGPPALVAGEGFEPLDLWAMSHTTKVSAVSRSLGLLP